MLLFEVGIISSFLSERSKDRVSNLLNPKMFKIKKKRKTHSSSSHVCHKVSYHKIDECDHKTWGYQVIRNYFWYTRAINLMLFSVYIQENLKYFFCCSKARVKINKLSQKWKCSCFELMTVSNRSWFNRLKLDTESFKSSVWVK